MRKSKVEIKVKIGNDVNALLKLKREQGFLTDKFVEDSVLYYHQKLLKQSEERTRPVRMGPTMKKKEEIFWLGFWVGVCFCSITVFIGSMIANYIKLF